MHRRNAATPAQMVSAEFAASLVRSNSWLDYGVSLSQPDVFDRALAARSAELSNVKIRACLTMRPRAVLEADPPGNHFHWFNWHFSGYDRKQHDLGRCHYIPLNLGEVPDYYRRFLDPVDIVILKTCPADQDGYFNFGPTSMWHGAAIESAKMVIVEISKQMPVALGLAQSDPNAVQRGDQNAIHISEVDYIIEGNDQATPALSNPAPSSIDRTIAQFIAAEVEDGACLQIGIGSMPNTICSLLLESGVNNLGVHTEMLTDGIIDLYKAGRINGKTKNLNPGKIVFTFAIGSASMYETLNGNRDFLCTPVDYTNSPHLIMQNDKVISINNTTQIDLQGQAASESDGFRHISGTGGQLQFVRGAYASKGGKSFICLASTYEKHGQRKSRINLTLTPGNIVTTPRSDVMYVATEYGLVNLKGKSVPERAKALIGLAHPDFREELSRQAHEQRMLPRGFSC